MLIMKMSVLGMKRISTMGSDRSEKEIIGYCARNISRFALGACGNKEESKSSNQSASTDSAEQIFQRSCAGCHATDLSGATGPDLRKVGGKYDAADIEEIIKKVAVQCRQDLFKVKMRKSS